MKRRAFLVGAIALPFITLVRATPFNKRQRVLVSLPLLFQEGDARSYVLDGRVHTPIGDKMQRAIESVLKANPNLSPDLKRPVAFDLRKQNGKPWGKPGAVRLPAETVFRKTGPITAPRNAIMAKGLARTLHGREAPAIEGLSRVVVKAVFNVAQA